VVCWAVSQALLDGVRWVFANMVENRHRHWIRGTKADVGM
jgi:hypothetical protein